LQGAFSERHSRKQNSAEYDYYDELVRLLLSVLTPEEARIVATILLNRVIERHELRLLFECYNERLEHVLRALMKKGVLERGQVFYSVSTEGLLRLVREKRREIEKTKKILEILEREICHGNVSSPGK
jgi:predicted DNA-binding transcriptional regulator